MTGKSQAALVAAAIESAEKIAMEHQRFIRWLKDIQKTVEYPALVFNEKNLSFSWNYGQSFFRKGAFEPFTMLQALYNAESKRLSHAELAEIVYGDDFASIKGCAARLAKKLERCGCPFQLDKDEHYYWLY